MLLILIMIFTVYFISNIKPNKVKYNFENYIKDDSFIKDCYIENNKTKTTIYFETNSEIFKEYNYHSYVSGDGCGKKIRLETYLISKDKTLCYKIKTNCYDYSDVDNIKFVSCYYNNFIKSNTKYNLAIYAVETNTLYLTDIEV